MYLGIKPIYVIAKKANPTTNPNLQTKVDWCNIGFLN